MRQWKPYEYRLECKKLQLEREKLLLSLKNQQYTELKSVYDEIARQIEREDKIQVERARWHLIIVGTIVGYLYNKINVNHITLDTSLFLSGVGAFILVYAGILLYGLKASTEQHVLLRKDYKRILAKQEHLDKVYMDIFPEEYKKAHAKHIPTDTMLHELSLPRPYGCWSERLDAYIKKNRNKATLTQKITRYFLILFPNPLMLVPYTTLIGLVAFNAWFLYVPMNYCRAAEWTDFYLSIICFLPYVSAGIAIFLVAAKII